VDLEVTILGELVLTAVDMEMGRGGRIRSVYNIDVYGGKLSFEAIIADPLFYLNVPGEGWIQMKTKTIGEETGLALEALNDPMAFYGGLFPDGGVPWELYTVESLGQEEVDGVQTEHLSIEWDIQEIWNHMDEEQKQRLFQGIPVSDINKEILINLPRRSKYVQ
jgi:hypothetical protein